MTQPFCSIYTKSYRYFDRESEVEKAKPCLYFSELKENFLPSEDSKTIYNPERDEAVLKDLSQKRLVTTYQKSYCMSEGKKSMVIDPNNLDADEFMVHFNNYFAKKTQAVPRPLLSGRRIFGYCRFDNYYTGKTVYEEDISREAYNYFKRDYDAGKSRLFWKKQKAMQRLKASEDLDRSEQEGNPDLGEVSSPRKNALDKNEKICALCCEKFGEFSCGVPDCKGSNDGRQTEPENGSA